jgi:DNA-binding NarL/FixJ family response regulator
MTARLKSCILKTSCIGLFWIGLERGLDDFRVLIISGHPLFAEAITHLLQEQGITEIITVNSLNSALPLLRNQLLETIIVDHDDPNLRDAEVVSRLVDSDETRNVIFLTLADNQMIVHHRSRVENVTPNDLIQALHPAKD